MTHSPAPGGGFRGRTVSLLAAMGLVAALAGCSGNDIPRDVSLLDGEGVEAFFEGNWHPIAVGDRIPDGAEIRAGATTASFRIAGDELWLSAGASAITDGAVAELQHGEVLALSDGGLTVRWGDVELNGAAIYRLTPGVAARLRTYEGVTEVRRPGEWRSLNALREVGLVGRRLPIAAIPLSYTRDDEWDARLLARALAFDDEMERLAAGIDRQFGMEPQPLSFYLDFTSLEPGLLPLLARISSYNDGTLVGPPSDPLVSLFVARSATSGDEDLREVTIRVAKLRAAGARWGLIATEFGITTARLTAAVDLGRRVASVLDEVPRPPSTSGGQTQATARVTEAPRPTPTGDGTPPPPGPSPSPAPNEPPPPIIPDLPSDVPAPPSETPSSNPLEQILESLLGDAADIFP